jgi:hypothetical protein
MLKKYSIDEIEQMRDAILSIESIKQARDGWITGCTPAAIEEKVRTHMMNGTDVSDLKKYADELGKKFDQERLKAARGC